MSEENQVSYRKRRARKGTKVPLPWFPCLGKYYYMVKRKQNGFNSGKTKRNHTRQ